MFRRVIAFVAALLIGQSLFAQFSISGTVKDQNAQVPLQGASVRLRSVTTPTVSQNAISDSAGRFTFQNLASDSFLLSISFVGFKDVSRGIRVDSSSTNLDSAAAGTINLDIAMVPNSSNDLATVVISTRVAPATQKGDTLQINASQFKVNPDASAEDLAKKVPGITIENGQVKAQGETVQKVTIDGRELFGDDATAALRNLPAEVVDKIQIFDRLSDQAQLSGVDDGNTTKGINIVTKANMRNGQFGRIYAGYGTDERYSAGGNATILKDNRRISIVGNFNNINQQNFSQQDLLGVTSNGGRGGGGGGFRGGPGGGGGNFRGGGGNFGGGGGNFNVGTQNGINRTNAFGINFSDIWSKKLTVTGSYLFNNTQNVTSQLSNTKYFNSDISNIIDTTRSVSKNNNHRLNMRLEYRIDSMNQLIITPNVSFQKNNSMSSIGTSTHFFVDNNPVVQTLNTNITDANRSGLNLNNSILYRRSFKKRGRSLTVNLNTSYNDREGETYYNTFQRSIDTTNFRDTAANRFTDQANNTYQISTNISYSEPLGQNSQLQFSYNPRFSKSESNQQTFKQDPTNLEYTDFLRNFSNVLETRTTAQNGGLTYRWGDRDRMISFGVNYQHTNLKSDQAFPTQVKVDKSFSNFLPNAMIRYKLSTRSNIRLFYRTNVNEPSVTQLQGVLDPTNAPVYTIGDVNLNTQFTHIGSAQYTFTNTSKGLLLVGNIFYQKANDYIANATFTPKRDTLVAGVLIPGGSRITSPVNLDGYNSLRSSLTFAVPVGFIKSNLNLTAEATMSEIPGITNNIRSITNNSTYTLGTGIASNVSQYVDFNISYRGSYNKVRNETQPNTNPDYFQHVLSVQSNLLTKKGWFFQNDFNSQMYNGLSEGFDQNYILWNMSVGKKILKAQKGEIKLSVFDLLKQNQSISRNIVDGQYIQDVQNEVLRQYFMLYFTYNLRNFGTAAARQQNREQQRNFGDGPRF